MDCGHSASSHRSFNCPDPLVFSFISYPMDANCGYYELHLNTLVVESLFFEIEFYFYYYIGNSLGR